MKTKPTKYYTQGKFAKICNVTRQAISEAVQKKLIHKDPDGIDADHPLNKKYRTNAKLNLANGLRSIAAKKLEPGQIKKNKRNNRDSMVPITIGNVTVDIPSEEFEQNSELNNELIATRYLIARTSKIEQEDLKLKIGNARLRGELLDRDEVYNGMFLYLDKLNSNLERMAGTFLNDIGYKIINAEEVTPNVRQEWIDGVLKQIDAAKKETMKKLKSIAESQK